MGGGLLGGGDSGMGVGGVRWQHSNTFKHSHGCRFDVQRKINENDSND